MKHAAAYVLLAVALTVALYQFAEYQDNQRRSDLITGCERGNITRGALGDFLLAAAAARKDGGNFAVARSYYELYDRLAAAVVANPVVVGGTEIDCEKAVH